MKPSSGGRIERASAVNHRLAHPYVPITEGGNLRKVVARASVADNLARIFVESIDRVRA